MTRANNLLGRFNLEGIPPLPRGTAKVDVTFDIDADGILNVIAIENQGKKSCHITVRNEKGRLTSVDIDRMIDEAQEFEEIDNAVHDRIAARNELESYAYNIRNTVAGMKNVTDEDAETIDQLLIDALVWIDEHRDAEKEVFNEKLDELQDFIKPLLQQVYGHSCLNQYGLIGPGKQKTVVYQ